MTRILGISAYYHDSAACLVVDGDIVAAAQEERFTRKKHDDRLPLHAVDYCLREGGISIADVDHVGFYEKPIAKFDRLLETYIGFAPQGIVSFLKSMPLWMREKLWMADAIRKDLGFAGKVLFGDHHESHAASAFYPSPFEEAAVLTMDGVGEWATASIAHGQGHALTMLKEVRFPHSVGLLYSAFTYFTGFRVNSGEYKLMGLAPYGEPKYVDVIRDRLLEINEDGSIWLNQEYFNYCQGLTMTSPKFDTLFGGPPRQPEAPVTQREMDIARSIQEVTEEIMLRMARHAHRITGARRLCLAGGVALNCVGNGRLLREGPFEDIWIQPASGDAGGALGVALAIWHRMLDQPRVSAETTGAWMPARHAGGNVPPCADAMHGSFLGPAFSEDEIGQWISDKGYRARKFDRPGMAGEVAARLADGQVVGLLQGRMEFGPRALGGRSILGDPRSPAMQSVMNLKIKYRESFRPFAPAVMREHVHEWFDLASDSPYMLLVSHVHADRLTPPPAGSGGLWGIERLNVPRSSVPAVTHVDNSARIQTVRPEQNPFFHQILSAFYARTGCPVLVNTSFNVRGEPIVCSPEDACRCFMRTEMDCLVLETYLLEKSMMPRSEADSSWQTEFALD